MLHVRVTRLAVEAQDVNARDDALHRDETGTTASGAMIAMMMAARGKAMAEAAVRRSARDTEFVPAIGSHQHSTWS